MLLRRLTTKAANSAASLALSRSGDLLGVEGDLLHPVGNDLGIGDGFFCFGDQVGEVCASAVWSLKAATMRCSKRHGTGVGGSGWRYLTWCC